MEELYNKIEDYLAGDMSAADKEAFEQALQKDPELLAEVNLHRQLQATFSDSQEMALRQSLKEISADFSIESTTPPATKPFYQNIWFYLGLLATLLVIYLISRNQNLSNIQQEDTPTLDTLLQEDLDTSNTLSTIDSVEESIPEEPSIEEASPTPPIPNRADETTRDPFATNSVLEALLDPEVWSFQYDFDLNANVIELDEGSNIVIDGELTSTELEGEQFTIVVFDNQSQNYPSSPLLRQILRPREIEDNQPVAFGGKLRYSILLDEIIKDLEPGLYYYQVYMESEAEPLHTGSFRKSS